MNIQQLALRSVFLSIISLVPANGQRKIGERCENSNDCGSQLVCYERYCEVAEPVDGERCSTANQCRRGNTCKHGICWTFARIPCRKDRDCPPSLYCNRNICLSQRSSERYCTGNRRPYYSRGQPMECDIRGHRNQCPPNYFCDPRTEYCCEDDDDSRERKPDSSRENLALGDRCNESRKRNPCRTENADCINGRCRCISGYEEENSRCVKKETRRRKSLGKECKTTFDCEIPYSECVGKICTCREGYVNDGETCRPKLHSCPSLAPLTVGGKIKKCEITFSRDRSPKDNCPEGSFCVSYGSPPASGKRLRAGIAEGFCCPKMDSVCPVGNPIYVADQNCEKNCPQDTHFCHQSGEHIWREVCCEKPCVGDQILEGGNCVRDRYDGRSPECPLPGGKLGKRSGRCDSQLKEAISGCKPGMLFIHGKCVEPLCSRGTPLFTKGFNFVRCHGNCTESGTFCEKIYGICCSTK